MPKNVQPRQHQLWIESYGAQLSKEVGGHGVTTLLAVPGAGKSFCVVKMAEKLGLPVVWVAPRLALQVQAVETMLDDAGMKLSFSSKLEKGHVDGFATNYHAISVKGGVVEHVKAINKISQAHGGKPVFLVVDEFHHLSGAHLVSDPEAITDEEAEVYDAYYHEGWGGAFDLLYKQLVRAGLVGHVLLMSGTPYRQDRVRSISLLEYQPMEDPEYQKLIPSVAMHNGSLVELQYTRQMAKEDKAVLPLHMEYVDGDVDVESESGSYQGLLSECQDPSLFAKTLGAYLESKPCTQKLLNEALHHYVQHQAVARTQMLVVAGSIASATNYLRYISQWLSSKSLPYGVGVAVSKGHLCKNPRDKPEWVAKWEETGDASYVPDEVGITGNKKGEMLLAEYGQYMHEIKTNKVLENLDEAIKEGSLPESETALGLFRHRKLDILVTVGKAYEGLDAPGCSHLAFLGRIRSVPWLTQCFARAWRMDYGSGLPYEEQKAYIFAPADAKMFIASEKVAGEDVKLLQRIKALPSKEGLILDKEELERLKELTGPKSAVKDGRAFTYGDSAGSMFGYVWEENEADPSLEVRRQLHVAPE